MSRRSPARDLADHDRKLRAGGEGYLFVRTGEPSEMGEWSEL
ncbi:hypothetical protein ACQPZX_35410 [Actinoplanes sp. CA-142083]